MYELAHRICTVQLVDLGGVLSFQATLKDEYTIDVEVVWRRALRLVVNGMVQATSYANNKSSKECVVQ